MLVPQAVAGKALPFTEILALLVQVRWLCQVPGHGGDPQQREPEAPEGGDRGALERG